MSRNRSLFDGPKKPKRRREIVMPFYEKEDVCWWCGQIYPAPFHLKCLQEYHIAVNFEQATRKAVFKKDGGVCAECGKQSKKWQADHKWPLFRVDRQLPWIVLKLYGGEHNLQTLCVSCHKRKTKREIDWLNGKQGVRWVGEDVVREGVCSGRIPVQMDEETKERLHRVFGWNVKLKDT